jgi:hypothetical protein
MFFPFLYEDGSPKPVEVILRREREMRENNGRDELN